MTVMLVIRDAARKVINIGPWEEMLVPADSKDPTGPQVSTNPLPDGATEAQEDVTRLPDGGRVVTAEIPTDADVAEREIRGSKALLALGRIALGDNTATEDIVVAAVRNKLP